MINSANDLSQSRLCYPEGRLRTPELEKMEEKDANLEPAFRKKQRRKKNQEKWNSLHFVPLDVINFRKKVNGRLNNRKGLEIHRDLACKLCAKVFHTRNAIRLHSEKHHTRTPSAVPLLSSKSNSRMTANATRSQAAYRRGTQPPETVELDDESDDDDAGVELLEDETRVANSSEGTKNASTLSSQPSNPSHESVTEDTGIEVLEDESRLANSSVGSKDTDELTELAKSSLFQPEVTLSLDLTKAIKKHKPKESPTPAPRALNETYTKHNSSFNSALASLLKPVGTEDEKCKTNSKGNSKNKKTKGSKRPLSSENKTSGNQEEKEIDWSAVIRGNEIEETKKIKKSVCSSSPVKKKTFKPVSLLDKFNDSTRDDSGIDDSGIVVSPILKPVTKSPKRPLIRVRDFARATNEPDISIVELEEKERNNSTSAMFFDIVEDMRHKLKEREHRKRNRSVVGLDESMEESEISVINPREEEEDDIVTLDVDAFDSGIGQSSAKRLKGNRAKRGKSVKRKITSTPKPVTRSMSPDNDIEIVDIV